MNQDKTHTLVNFISPIQTLETFDQICDFRSATRTSILLMLMKDFIMEQSTSIPHQIQSLQNLKNDLSNFELFKTDGSGHKTPNNRNLTRENRFNNRSTAMAFFIDEDAE
jgi:hypothetical protein